MFIFAIPNTDPAVGPVRPGGKQQISIYKDGIRRTINSTSKDVDKYLSDRKKAGAYAGAGMAGMLVSMIGGILLENQAKVKKASIIGLGVSMASLILGLSAYGVKINRAQKELLAGQENVPAAPEEPENNPDSAE
ncbi:MAG: hypothetical protein LBK53_04780 [Heliobacteriaceae bacterium]|jgi:hypothetical protein|nr:hypothetical protein [Heliobacteriaceae bacterium]